MKYWLTAFLVIFATPALSQERFNPSRNGSPPELERVDPNALDSLIVVAPISDAPELFASQMQLSDEAICWYFNPDGSCVQCSIGMVGVHCKDLNAASLLWKTAYGKAERGGSYPSRVKAYFDRRGIRGWNVTGWPVTREWAIWSTQTGRFAAIGFFGSHFQTLYAYNPKSDKPWGIMNNWARTNPSIDWYSEKDFQRLHLASGPWIVVLERPGSDNPEIVQYWK